MRIGVFIQSAKLVTNLKLMIMSDFSKKESFSIRRSYDGSLRAETKLNVDGVNWLITTSKWRNNMVRTSCNKVQPHSGGGFTMSVSMRENKGSFSLNPQKVSRLTEKKLKELHLQSLAMFDAKKEAGELPTNDDYKIEIGQVIFTHGYQNEYRRAVYKIEETKWGVDYHTVILDGSNFRIDSHIRNIEDKFGIGVYYKEGDKVDKETLFNLVADTQTFVKERDEKQRIQAEKNKKERNELIAKGKALIQIPTWAKAIIVAKNYVNKSDPMTDYFATGVNETVFLGFSRSERNNMNELKEASKRFEGTKDFAGKGKEYETTDNCGAYLPTYFLGSDNWSGWKVIKDKYFLKHESNLDELYIAAAKGLTKFPKESETVKTEVDCQGLDYEIRINEERNGIEVIFCAKPSRNVLDGLKSLGFRWTRFNKLWYNKNTESNMSSLKELLK